MAKLTVGDYSVNMLDQTAWGIREVNYLLYDFSLSDYSDLDVVSITEKRIVLENEDITAIFSGNIRFYGMEITKIDVSASNGIAMTLGGYAYINPFDPSYEFSMDVDSLEFKNHIKHTDYFKFKSLNMNASSNFGDIFLTDAHIFKGNDNITGSSLNDTLLGYAGNDVLSGGGGSDKLIGGTGRDELIGGSNKDMFKFGELKESGVSDTSRDTITDFTRGQDKIDLSKLDANQAIIGNQEFSAPVVGGAFSGKLANPGDLYFDNVAHVLYANTNTDSTADMSIHLMGAITTLTASDFIL